MLLPEMLLRGFTSRRVAPGLHAAIELRVQIWSRARHRGTDPWLRADLTIRYPGPALSEATVARMRRGDPQSWAKLLSAPEPLTDMGVCSLVCTGLKRCFLSGTCSALCGKTCNKVHQQTRHGAPDATRALALGGLWSFTEPVWLLSWISQHQFPPCFQFIHSFNLNRRYWSCFVSIFHTLLLKLLPPFQLIYGFFRYIIFRSRHH
ncbi:uncharacterized protein BDR25DRAFT_356795 [Lindgomyces ingoldianus]|uniref:Uncharacterized protein n=1 Tax=Lindgomyces ingoldianus TaxID=673940 RepID=A0ACB6QRV8_9PLEO|nr:uncharacterized protein BDR25DRAFT_356795 [Lindgomyces ingoldianus]KAF2469032.1 hypothetical protein BDR25DRAFT_356795 [Lindgomyces ingoldianus]